MRDILFVTVDSLRADHVGAFGYERDTTPFMDEMAGESHVFEQTFAHAQATRNSFPSILTSTTPLMYGGTERISPDRTLVSEVLDAAGYRTAGFHSNLFLSEEFGYGRGFDTFYDSQEDPGLLARLRDGVRRNLNQDGALYQFLKWAFDRTERHAGVELGALYTTAADLTDLAVEWLRGVDEGPGFCWVHYMDVHHPYVPPEKHQREFRASPIDDRQAIQLRRKMLEEPAEITSAEMDDLIDLYDAELRFVDTQLERLVATARRELADPVVVVTADHGEEFREHGNFSHGTVHDEGIHVPLLVHDGSEAGRYNGIVGLMDVAPTIVDYADRPAPDSFCGYSLRDLIDGGEFERTHVVGEWGEYPDRYNRFYRDTEWKYIDGEDRRALYHLPDDPVEQEDVRDAHPETVERIEGILSEHEDEVAATQTDTAAVDMDEEVVDRLEQLGYKME